MSRLLPEKDPTMGLMRRLTDGRVEMGLYPVIFGWRVRAGLVGEMSYHCDWCCGDDPMVVFGGYYLMRRLLEAGVMLESLPRASKIKPWPKDDQFMNDVKGLLDQVGGYSPQEEKQVFEEPINLAVLRKEFMSKWMKEELN